MTALSPRTARRIYLTLVCTRWLPVGLIVGIIMLWQLERGQSVAFALTATSVLGFVVFFLELPTSSFADVFGRRPVYVTAAVLNVIGALLYLIADSLWWFVTAAAVTGVFRALDSGPLDAWFVDVVHETEPEADVGDVMARAGTILGGSMAAGSLVTGGLILWHPVAAHSALWLPMFASFLLTLVHLVAVLVLMREPMRPTERGRVRRALDSARAAPTVVGEGLALLRTSRVLRGLVIVEIFWSITMVVYEAFQPIRLAEMLGSEEQAGAWMGVVAALGWAIFALGSFAAGLTSKRWGIARTAILGRVLNSLGAIVMGLVLGPAALVVAYLFTYSMHGYGGPMHSALLHREAQASNRATVLSMNSMMAFGAFAVSAPLLGVLAEVTSNQTAMVVAGGIGLVGVRWYFPARRAEIERLSVSPADR